MQFAAAVCGGDRPRLQGLSQSLWLRNSANRPRASFHASILSGSFCLTSLDSRLRLLGPEQVLARGYSITTDAQTGKVLRQAKEVKAGQRLKTRLKKGEVQSIVEM